MYRHEKTLCRDHGRFARYEKESPSFSSSLLEKIYRSIDDDGDKSAGEMSFFRETMAKKQSKSHGTRGIGKKPDEEETACFRRACLIEKWMDRKIGQTAVAAHRRRQYRHYSESERKYNDSNDALFFSSTSSSSDSSSGGFSSSDTESMFGAARPKPVRTAVAPEKKPSEPRARNGSCYRPHDARADCDNYDDEALIKSKSRALKIYDNLKKVKQPISPGVKLASFINSLFAGSGGGAKKTTVTAKTAISPAAPSFREAPPSSVTVCTSASSFSRSCLSKSSPSTRERLRSFAGEPKRSVRFYPVSVIVDEDSRPCGHKSLREDRRPAAALPVSVPTARKTGRSPAAKGEESELRIPAREFLRDYRQNQMKNELMIMRDQFRTKNDVVRSNKDVVEQEDYENDDDSASCSSADLFELDHLAVRYQEELPVYETTRVDRNRAIF